MRRCLIIISMLCFWGLSLCHAQNMEMTDTYTNDSTTSREYHLFMQIKGHDITGICVMDFLSEEDIVGTIMNEFGVKAFDFTFNNGKIKVFHVVGPLNKWYIRKILRKDFSFILSGIRQGKDLIQKKRTLAFLPNGEIRVNNNMYKICYTFTPMNSKL